MLGSSANGGLGFGGLPRAFTERVQYFADLIGHPGVGEVAYKLQPRGKSVLPAPLGDRKTELNPHLQELFLKYVSSGGLKCLGLCR